MMSNPDQLKPPAVGDAGDKAPSDLRPRERVERSSTSRGAMPMVWRVFAANAAVFALAFALLALAPVTLHASIRLEELVLLLVGLVVMLIVDLLLIRQALEPLARLANVMRSVDLLRPRASSRRL
jgi:two-component system sensor histidine kinase UhpB